MKDAQQALAALVEGNRRFVDDLQAHSSSAVEPRRYQLVERQAPFAIIIGCSDARVPAEIIFDQGLGELFVIRIAGNVITPSGIGSVEFAAELFATPLVVVMGHSRCGAVEATLQELEQPSENRSPNLKDIVDRIRPAVEPLLEVNAELSSNELIAQAVRANIQASVDQLRHGSEILENLITQNRLLVVGAEYSIETGCVEFFDRVDNP